MEVRLSDDARASLLHARAAVVASGTATVETALIGTPFVMVYRLGRRPWALGRHLVKLPHYGMVNLIAGRRLVPELIQEAFTAGSVERELRPLLAEGEPRRAMQSGLAEMRARLRGASGRLRARGQDDLQPFFVWHPWLYLFLVPALGMRLWAEERKSGTVELLLTLPVSMSEAVIGKFLAAWCMVAIALALPAAWPAVVGPRASSGAAVAVVRSRDQVLLCLVCSRMCSPTGEGRQPGAEALNRS